jgi:low density lipoprotein receptor-related protein 5/6
MNCIPPRSYLIYSLRGSFGRLLPNATDAPDAPLTVLAKTIRSVEYDPIQHYVYWVS